MALAQQPNYNGTGYRTFSEYEAARHATKLRLELMQQQCAFIDKVIFLPRVFPTHRSLIHLPDIVPRTFIGQHVFSLVKGSVILNMPTGPIILAIPQETGPQTWRLEYDPTFYDDQLSALQNDGSTIRTSYDNTSIDDMASFRANKEHYQKRNCGMFNKLPQEVRTRIYAYVAVRAFGVTDAAILEDTNAFEFWDSEAEDVPAAKPSVLLNLQLTCSYFHNDVTQFLYDENEFYFSCPDSLEHFLLCLQMGPFNVHQSRHLGGVILDLRRGVSFPPQGRTWPAIPMQDPGNDGATMVKALLEFQGRGRIGKIYKAGRWPNIAENKVLQMLKDTLEEEVEEGSDTKHKRTMHSKKRKRPNEAVADTTID